MRGLLRQMTHAENARGQDHTCSLLALLQEPSAITVATLDLALTAIWLSSAISSYRVFALLPPLRFQHLHSSDFRRHFELPPASG